MLKCPYLREILFEILTFSKALSFPSIIFKFSS